MQNITSYLGEAHVTSDQFRGIIESIVGGGTYIANLDEQLEPELSANNTLKIRSGVLIHHGHVMRVPPGTYDTVTYINGSQGMKRIDLVVARYEKNSETKKEPTKWVVIQGTPDASSPVAPDYNEGNMQDGDLIDDCPVFEMHFDGINVTEVKKLVEVTKNIDDLRKDVDKLNSTLGNIGKTFQQLVLISGNQESSFDCGGYRFLYLFATCGGKAFTQFIPVSILRNEQETYVFGAAYTTSKHGVWIEIKLSRNKVSLIDAKMNGDTVLAYVYVNGIN